MFQSWIIFFTNLCKCHKNKKYNYPLHYAHTYTQSLWTNVHIIICFGCRQLAKTYYNMHSSIFCMVDSNASMFLPTVELLTYLLPVEMGFMALICPNLTETRLLFGYMVHWILTQKVDDIQTIAPHNKYNQSSAWSSSPCWSCGQPPLSTGTHVTRCLYFVSV